MVQEPQYPAAAADNNRGCALNLVRAGKRCDLPWASYLMKIKRQILALLTVSFAFTCLYAADPDVGPPSWAYGTDPVAAGLGRSTSGSRARDLNPRYLAGADLTFTYSQIQDRFAPADWFPSDHPKMPEVVARGRQPQVWACALCHYPNGKGRPENAGVAGLPNEYFIEQM